QAVSCLAATSEPTSNSSLRLACPGGSLSCSYKRTDKQLVSPPGLPRRFPVLQLQAHRQVTRLSAWLAQAVPCLAATSAPTSSSSLRLACPGGFLSCSYKRTDK